MKCMKCNTQLKYVFNMMTVCPKCDYGDTPQAATSKNEIQSKYDIIKSIWTDYIVFSDGQSNIVFYADGLSKELSDYKFLFHLAGDNYNYFCFTKGEAKSMLNLLKSVGPMFRGATVLLSMDKGSSSFTYMGGSDYEYRFSGAQGEIKISDNNDLINFLEQHC